jgi:putative Mn2+ efflux pump MntP
VNLNKTRVDRDIKIARLLRSFGVIMAIFYFVMGLTFVSLPLFDSIPSLNRYGISILLMVYGCYRLYRFFKPSKKNNHEEQDDE